MGEPYQPPPAHPKLQARALTRTFGRAPHAVGALGPLDLAVAPGEFVCLVGPSGCGKSTLLRIAAGLLRPSAGRLEIRSDSPRPAAMIFQDYGIRVFGASPWQMFRHVLLPEQNPLNRNLRATVSETETWGQKPRAGIRFWIPALGLQ